jgi:flagellar hook-basal body complex protein FliE
MTIDPTAAARAYGQALQTMAGKGGQAPGLNDDGDGFGALLQTALGNTASGAQATEAKMAAIGSGDADIVDLVTAVAQTEIAVETLVTVRDRVISAYQEILNMPI